MKKRILKSLEGFVESYVRRLEDSQTKSIIVQELNKKNKVSNEHIVDRNQNFIVSLTTFGKRIHEVYLAIESIGEQTLKPERIVLWLSEKEFKSATLPITLKNLEKRGLEIMYCQDTRAYKKLIPSVEAFPDKVIITVDDDVLYGQNLLELLMGTHKKYPEEIICGFAKEIAFENGSVATYSKWLDNSELCKEGSIKNMAIGFGGVVYFPGCFSDEIGNVEKFMKYSPYNDDLWFKTMTAVKGVKVRSINHLLGTTSQYIPLEVAQKDSLSIFNVIMGKNDEQFGRLLKDYRFLDSNC